MSKVFLLILGLSVCLCQPQEKGRLKLDLEPQKIKGGLSLAPRWLYAQNSAQAGESDKAGFSEAEQKQSVVAITQVLERLILAIHEKKPHRLKDLVHPQEGLYVDLKAHWTYERLISELESGKGYIYEVLLGQGDPLDDSFSVYKILQLSSKIEIDYYMQAKSCEIKLHLSEAAQSSYQLNNPVFIRRSGAWYVYRLF